MRIKRAFEWLFRYIDVLVALTLAVVILGLDVIGVASSKVVANATVATLAVVAIVLLRDRQRGDERGAAVLTSVERANERLARLERAAVVREVTGDECSEALAQARKGAARWFFKGSTGTYVRAVTLPECVERSRRARRSLTFRLEILDPADEGLCNRFVALHQRLATSPDSAERFWTMDGTRRELYATVLAACWHQQRYELLDIDVRLSSTFSLLRYELTESCLIITQRGPEFPATIIDCGTPTYDCWESELHVSLQQARRLPLHRVRDMPLSEEPTTEEIRALFRALDLDLPAEYDEDDVIELGRMSLATPNPYE
ncbi:hypothetical protein [Actinomadura rudentiformis]|uniref:Uncharacterized protein n=1 Tax=Actinomadura rudentiformis TaxID=359158 RepID=A0A6H9YWW4_9ACTN|nr:hypothetical protein [Actinomadura rudentiformis]KAB2346342.1 hypothetical protein F8566_22950 [Actinomadura rudentiformis]